MILVHHQRNLYTTNEHYHQEVNIMTMSVKMLMDIAIHAQEMA